MSHLNQTCATLALLMLVPSAVADELSIGSAKDNTLYEHAQGGLSNGAGEHFFSGRTGQPAGIDIRRGLIEFDVAGALPAGAVITSARLRLHMSKSSRGPSSVSLQVAQLEWGEGASDASAGEGAGAPAEAGDATWLHTFFSSSFWANAGGDFAVGESASTVVGGNGFYEWATPQMIAELQLWLDDASQNHGWVLIGDELRATSAKRFDTKESPGTTFRPELIVEFDPPAVGTKYCFGVACPCGNDAPTAGCGNGSFPTGCALSASGSASIGADNLTLSAASSTPGQPGLFFQANNAINGGNGIPFGDGLRCAGGNVVRLEVVTADGSGAASSTVSIATDGGASAGDIKRYQWWYRDPAASPCLTGFNLSNGVELTWIP